ncbi:MAG: DUF2071 domain-containing protein [Caldilineaceae bacterium]|nr:DUF2071 domain-containing protein [Caldilineaceae bacterium]
MTEPIEPSLHTSPFAAILKAQEHRPWPLPPGPWVMAQQWLDLLFAHWPIPFEVMRAVVPPQLPLDTWDGMAWIGVVPFRMQGVRPRWVTPMPWLSAFPELNVRTYVTVRDRGVEKRGVYFFSLEAANPVAVAIARRSFKLPYFHALMSLVEQAGVIDYRSHRIHRHAPAAEFAGRYQPTGATYAAKPGSFDAWLTERYALYTVDWRGQPLIGEIHHVPWPLQPATATLTANTMAAANNLTLPALPPILHFARHLDVVVWPLRPVERRSA